MQNSWFRFIIQFKHDVWLNKNLSTNETDPQESGDLMQKIEN